MLELNKWTVEIFARGILQASQLLKLSPSQKKKNKNHYSPIKKNPQQNKKYIYEREGENKKKKERKKEEIE